MKTQLFAILTGLMLVLPAMVTPAHAGDDRSFTFEFMLGTGDSKSHKGFAFRLRQDNIEGHVAHWSGDRKNTAFGLGMVADTEGDGTAGNKDFHASATAGGAFVLNKNERFAHHFVPFGRVAAGSDLLNDGDIEFVISASQYGFVGESFFGVGLKHNNRYSNEDQPLTTTTQSGGDDNGDGDDDDNGDDDDCKPGVGSGDENHCHGGPPGRD